MIYIAIIIGCIIGAILGAFAPVIPYTYSCIDYQMIAKTTFCALLFSNQL